MKGERKALIVANDEYEHEGLRDLLAPTADAEALGQVLSDPKIGEFAVQVIRNRPAYEIQAKIEDLFADSRPDDLILLHYSGHGMKSESGELFLAAPNTLPTRLRATAVAADFVLQCMRDSRSRSIVLLLDCCYAGAFAQGSRPRAADDINVLDSFPSEKSGGRGRGVITASSAMEYAFEGGQLADDQHREPSVFTAALVEGLATGDADRDEDGWVSLAELYSYVHDQVHDRNPNQTPGCQFDFEGELYLAHSGRMRIRPARVPADLQAAIASPDMYARLGAVGELRARLAGDNLPVAVSAYESLTDLARNDIRYVAEPAAAALSEAAPRPAVTELDFGTAEQGSVPPHQTVALLGPPIARTCTPRPSGAWIRVDQVADGLDVSVDTRGPGGLRGTIALAGPTGRAVIAVGATVLPPVAEPDSHPPTPAAAPASVAPTPDPAAPMAAAAAPPTAPAAPAKSPAWTVPAAAKAAPASVMSPATPASARQDAPRTGSVAAEASHAPSAAAKPQAPARERRAPTDAAARPALFSAASLVLLLVTLGIDAWWLLRDSYAGVAVSWAVIAISATGIVASLPDIRRNALISSLLLWNLGLSVIYWGVIVADASSASTGEFHLLCTLCSIAAAGNIALCIGAFLWRPRGATGWHVTAAFTALTGVSWLLVALAWAIEAYSGVALWEAGGGAAIAAIVAGLFVGQALVRGKALRTRTR
jgi:hypothetical protein